MKKGLVAIALVLILCVVCTPMGARTQDGGLLTGIASTMYVNGVQKTVTTYEIGGEAYVRLRDIASLLSDTDKAFDMPADTAGRDIGLTSGQAYTERGGELAQPAGAQKATLTNKRVSVDGARVLMTVYDIGGELCGKLTAIGAALDVSAGVTGGMLFMDSAAPFAMTLPENSVRLHSDEETIRETAAATIKRYEMRFDSGEIYWIQRYAFKEDAEALYTASFDVPGTTLVTRHFDNELDRWVATSETGAKPFETLFLQTEKYSVVIGVPGLYEPTANHTLTIQREDEMPVTITKKADGTGFTVEYSFRQKAGLFGEIWAVQSAIPLEDLKAEDSAHTFRLHNLEWKSRWSMDGYYFPAPESYNPGGGNVLYCNPASYTATALVSYPTSRLSYVLGYAMMKTIVRNQNELGYFPTTPESMWLSTDFGIKENFYDTRFNTDLAHGLLYAHYRYDDPAFLLAVRRYIEFFLWFAEEHHYDIDGGWLIEDYWSADEKLPTHVSLNHHLAEINYLIRHYTATKDERCLELLNRMLDGVRNTEEQWIMEDGNLEYGLYYTGTYNTMRDYPYLTYNDLFETRQLLKRHMDREEPFIERLMATKREWMDRNGVTEYRK